MSEALKPTKGQSVTEQLAYIKGIQAKNKQAEKKRQGQIEIRRKKGRGTVDDDTQRRYVATVKYCEYDGPGAPCPRLGTTVDHVTPKSVAHALGIASEEFGSRQNKENLCRTHHRRKDKTTPQRAALARDQVQGVVSVGFNEHSGLLAQYEERLKAERRRIQKEAEMRRMQAS